jgi:hypothetical protein
MHATSVLLSLINIDVMIEAGVTDNVFYHLRKLILSVLVIPGSCVWSFDTVVLALTSSQGISDLFVESVVYRERWCRPAAACICMPCDAHPMHDCLLLSVVSIYHSASVR